MQAVYGVLIIAFAVSRTLWLSDILLFLTGAALMVVFSTVTSLVQMIAPNEMRGRVMSIYMLAFRGGMPLGSLASGYLATLIGAPLVIVRSTARRSGRGRDLFPVAQPRSARSVITKYTKGIVFVCFVVSGLTLFAQIQPQPGTKLSFDQLKAQMFNISAGRRLKPRTWPGGARVAVGLSFDVDNATTPLATGKSDLGGALARRVRCDGRVTSHTAASRQIQGAGDVFRSRRQPFAQSENDPVDPRRRPT